MRKPQEPQDRSDLFFYLLSVWVYSIGQVELSTSSEVRIGYHACLKVESDLVILQVAKELVIQLFSLLLIFLKIVCHVFPPKCFQNRLKDYPRHRLVPNR